MENKLIRRAVEREIEIIGEATNRLLKKDDTIQIENARKIVDTRNWVIHGYDNVDDIIILGCNYQTFAVAEVGCSKIIERKIGNRLFLHVLPRRQKVQWSEVFQIGNQKSKISKIAKSRGGAFTGHIAQAPVTNQPLMESPGGAFCERMRQHPGLRQSPL